MAKLDYLDYQIVINKKPDIRELYLELTTACNLNCQNCYRHSWQQAGGMMARETWQQALAAARRLPELKRVVLGGIGEPLLHPDFKEIVTAIKREGWSLTITSNGFLLEEKLGRFLVEQQVDEIVVSIDGYSPEVFVRNRGESPDPLWANLTALHKVKQELGSQWPQVAAEMVVTRENYREIPALLAALPLWQINTLYLSQLLPVTAERTGEVFYQLYPTEELLSWRREVITLAMRYGIRVVLPQVGLNTNRSCRFVDEKKVVIRFDGEVAPCYRFLHCGKEYVFGRPKDLEAVTFGNILKQDLAAIWMQDEYVKFRFLEYLNLYPSCPDCEWVDGCDMVWHNREDCWGNTPSCADCLWARGLIFCP
ncbi:tungsten cofactor oxidoreductase radical SAM maturase [Carboxydocella sp. ULO1]|uniref:tungsten cofactor oxidoreductase radical SAM maturase n=1 Tax=Carboxydocella sp. ULO1 TaxID=1926599 RepID=UPI0009D4CC7C|nr:tungsten cofactor oxidoreductase radical SAM maturase [Carboxydocella sp. ULO1]GAW29399.1 tungsten cofactor oxidoreductase radical SAM maturase [Carboxydocella sp. ULO1]